jgi:hypothetical protein
LIADAAVDGSVTAALLLLVMVMMMPAWWAPERVINISVKAAVGRTNIIAAKNILHLLLLLPHAAPSPNRTHRF